MPDRAPREDWGASFRSVVSSGRTGSGIVLLGTFPFITRTEGLAQVFFVIVGLIAVLALFPKSPLIPAIVQWLPKLPKQGE